jgi:PAS domain S-box-containing protein
MGTEMKLDDDSGVGKGTEIGVAGSDNGQPNEPTALSTMKGGESRRTSNPTDDSQSTFQSIFEHSPLAIMFTDAEGVITTCNDNASQLFGAPKTKLIGFSFRSIRDDLMRAAVAKALSGQKSRFEGEYLTVTGNILTQMRANFSPAFNSDGEVSGVIGIFEDITDRQLVEKNMQGLIRELQNALAKVKEMGGLLPICASCKRIRDENGVWNAMECYLRDHYNITFSHGMCPECVKKMYKM